MGKGEASACVRVGRWPGDHGDASISSRIYDGLAAGAINVFLGDAILRETIAFAGLLPWRNMSVVVDPTAFHAHPARAIEVAVARFAANATRLHRALALRDAHIADVSWTHPDSRVALHAVRECARYLGASRVDGAKHVG
jgi:hypothetical protein